MREIPLTRGLTAIVDDTDYEWLSQCPWHAHRGGRHYFYACRFINGKQRVFMHRLLTNAPNGMEVDHINGDPLDNRRANLRLCTHGQNQMNSVMRDQTHLKGAHPHHNRWEASIRVNGRIVSLGTFDTEEEAGHAYDVAAREYFGEFAKVNANGNAPTAVVHTPGPADVHTKRRMHRKYTEFNAALLQYIQEPTNA